MNRTILLLTAALIALSGTTLIAQHLTLEQAMQLAEEHSFALKRAQATHEAATADLAAARAERFPTLSASGVGSYISDVATFNISLPGLPPLEREIGTHENYQFDVRLNMPLFTGGRISGGIGLAEAARDLQAALVQADRDRIYYLTRVEYLGLYRADELLRVSQASRERAEVIVRHVSSLYEAGVADSVAVLDALLAQSRSGLAVDQAQTNRRVAEVRLLTLLGLPISQSISLALQPPAPVTEPIAEPEQIQETKPELQTAAANVALSEARLQVSRADYLPSVAAFGGYSYGKPNLDRFGNTWNDYFTVGATLNWSFNLGGRSINRARAASYTLEAAQNDRENIHENLTREAQVAFEQLRLARTRYQTSQTEYQISSDNYRLAEIQHSEGVLSSNRLIEIEADLTAAEASLAAALADYYIARSAYYYAVGSDNLRKGL